MKREPAELLDRIEQLKTEQNAVILAHNYQPEVIQDAADYVGDSLDLSRVAANTTADVIVLCGVHFMAEGAAILAPHKTVILPELNAGCPLADMVSVPELQRKKAEHPDAVVVTYINSSAAVKAESDVCVTSSNALNVVNSLDADQILFVPDMNLGQFVAERTDKSVILWTGYCPTHHCVRADDVDRKRTEHPGAAVVVHPECRPEVVAAADAVFSTGGILAFARETDHRELIIGTEQGLLYRLSRENPDKVFHLLHPGLVCLTMKLISLDKLLLSLETLEPRVTVQPEIADGARRALDRMLNVT